MLTHLRNHFHGPYNFRYLWTYAGAVILPDMLGRFLLRLLGMLEMPIVVGVVVSGVMMIELLSLILRKMGFTSLNALVVSIGTLCIGLPAWPGMQPELGRSIASLSMLFGVGLSLPVFMREMHEFSRRNPNY